MTDALARVWAGAIHNEIKTWNQVPAEGLAQAIHGSVFRGWAAEEVWKGRLTLDQFTEEDRIIVEQALIDQGYGHLVPGWIPPEPDEPEIPGEETEEDPENPTAPECE